MKSLKGTTMDKVYLVESTDYKSTKEILAVFTVFQDADKFSKALEAINADKGNRYVFNVRVLEVDNVPEKVLDKYIGE